MEKFQRSRRGRSQSEVSTTSKREAMVKAVQEAKLAREDALNEDEDVVTITPTDAHEANGAPAGGDFIYKPNNNHGIPAITLTTDKDNGDVQDSCNDTDTSEKANMLRKYSIDTAQLGSKEKLFKTPDKPKYKGVLSGLPPHMRKEMLNGHVRQMNNSLPDVKTQCHSEETQPLANGLLEAEAGGGKSLSHCDINFLAVRPRRRRKFPLVKQAAICAMARQNLVQIPDSMAHPVRNKP